MTLQEMGFKAKEAAPKLAIMGRSQKDAVLYAMADALVEHAQDLIAANAVDLACAADHGISDAMLDRLRIDRNRVDAMAEGIRAVALLDDPTDQGGPITRRPNGLIIEKRRVPLGVIGIIYESRPNVTADAIALCVKSGNACILRGGSEAIHSNLAICNTMVQAAIKQGYPENGIQILEDTSRKMAQELMRLTGFIDVLIPRGGASLIRSVVENASVPVIETGLGNCHIYLDQVLDMALAEKIVINAKCQRPSVCNAMETLLVHSGVAEVALPKLATALIERGVELRCCKRALPLVKDGVLATEDDYKTEYNDLILAIKVVDSLEEAIEHINRYGTHHSEAIISKDYQNIQIFFDRVDAAAVYANASTRFTDGFEFGLGAEMGISTQKLHARGPMGLNELTSYKYVIYGTGQVRG